MIILNNREYPWRQGMTVLQLLTENGFVYKRIVVKINGQLVHELDWQKKEIQDGDDVSAMHLMAGG
jgi:thiamine biosynthesis protein ThiS